MGLLFIHAGSEFEVTYSLRGSELRPKGNGFSNESHEDWAAYTETSMSLEERRF